MHAEMSLGEMEELRLACVVLQHPTACRKV